MIEDDLRRLNESDADHLLDGLESDIWRGVLGRAQQRRLARSLVSVQGVVMAAALLGSIAAGMSLANPTASPAQGALLSPGVELAPSALLLGNRP